MSKVYPDRVEVGATKILTGNVFVLVNLITAVFFSLIVLWSINSDMKLVAVATWFLVLLCLVFPLVFIENRDSITKWLAIAEGQKLQAVI